MDNKIEELLNQKIEQNILALSQFVIGSEEYTIAVNNLEKLYQMKEDEEKLRNGDKESRMKWIQFYVGIGIALLELTIPLMCYDCWLNRGFEFETSGAITSSFLRQIINRIKPTK